MTTNERENYNQADSNFQDKNKEDKDYSKKINAEPEYIDPDDLGEEDLSNGYAGEDKLDKDYDYLKEKKQDQKDENKR